MAQHHQSDPEFAIVFRVAQEATEGHKVSRHSLTTSHLAEALGPKPATQKDAPGGPATTADTNGSDDEKK
jgi:hypothetical protein